MRYTSAAALREALEARLAAESARPESTCSGCADGRCSSGRSSGSFAQGPVGGSSRVAWL
ncbi:MAG: hypothetical protein ACRDYX_17785 [Egibacteraceae bacterium]